MITSPLASRCEIDSERFDGVFGDEAYSADGDQLTWIGGHRN
jgi:hypothetical protein